MKRILSKKALPFLLMFFFSLIQFALFAQDNTGTNSNSGTSKTTTTETTTTTTDWYAQPWVWVVGGAVLLIVLVALLRGNGSNTREVSRTTVIKDN
jgi:hypothetical protein